MTIESRLKTHLVIPDGVDAGVALKLGPGGKAVVDKVTGPVKDAERKGLVTIHYPGRKQEKPAGKVTGSKKKE